MLIPIQLPLQLFLVYITSCDEVICPEFPSTPAAASKGQDMSRHFLYFAYGSNLLSKRIHINNPTAVRYGSGKLEHYRLDFITYSPRWKGASATIVPALDDCLWGAIWKIDICNLPDLDRQEGVSADIYFPLELEIKTANGEKHLCRVYQQTITPSRCNVVEELPKERRPSEVYLRTMQQGAVESDLPAEYIEYLARVPHNGYNGPVDVGMNVHDLLH